MEAVRFGRLTTNNKWKETTMSSMRETNLVQQDGEHSLYGTWLSVDVVALTRDTAGAKVVLIERGGNPHRGATTLPGGLLASWNGETVDEAARRIVREKVGVEIDSPVIDLFTVSDKGRDERGHTVSIVVTARVPADTPGAVEIDAVPSDMPFGHSGMVTRAVDAISRRLLVDPNVTYALLGDRTTVRDAFSVVGTVSPSLTDSATRARIERSGLYRMAPSTKTYKEYTRSGRPPLEWVRV